MKFVAFALSFLIGNLLIAQVDTIIVTQHLLPFGYIYPEQERNPDVVIIHSSYCSEQKDSFNLQCILDLYKKYDVGAHYIIDREGIIFELIDECLIAHHAGKGTLPDNDNRTNTRSIGIELINTKNSDYTVAQYLSLAYLLKDIDSRWNIKYTLGHSDIAAVRKTDPWKFDWNKLKEKKATFNPTQTYILRL
ncbi:MAG: N-acetylmuramoyl-L-alanine amidase [Bacteroidota bacterium]|nr:N-acetylmuramoyl-L-alanine amidase [Bacteroidota bacterium]